MENVDKELFEFAILFHDVNQPADRKQEHVELSIRTAEKILIAGGCTNQRVRQVLEVIAQHSTEHIETIKPSSNEARILFDADK
jgi:uncharacterized protein